jgi:hypothetical protein
LAAPACIASTTVAVDTVGTIGICSNT